MDTKLKETTLLNFFKNILKSDIKSSEVWSGTTDNTYFTLLYLLNKHKNSCIVLPKYRLEEKKRKQKELVLVWDSVSTKLVKPNNFQAKLLECLNESTARFIIIPMTLKSKTDGHANFLILDKITKTVERYDPHGWFAIDYNQTLLDVELWDFFDDYEYLTPIEICPDFEEGLQSFADKAQEDIEDDKKIGYCVAWNILYTDLRLSYPDIPVGKLTELAIETINKDPSLLLLTIEKYSAYVKNIGKTYV